MTVFVVEKGVIVDGDDVDGADKDVAIFVAEVSAPSSDGCCSCSSLRSLPQSKCGKQSILGGVEMICVFDSV